MVVDDRVHELPADAHSLLGSAAVAEACDGVSGSAEAADALAVDVQEVARAGPLVAAGLLARPAWPAREAGASKRPPNSRVRMPGLAGDQPWAPTGAAPGSADRRLLARREHARAAMGP